MQGGPGGLRSPVGAGAAGVQHADPNRLLRRRLRPRVCQHPADERPDGVRAGGGARRGGARGAGAHQLVPQGDAVVRRLQLRRGRGAHQLLAVRHHGPARQLPQPHLEGADHLHAQRVGGARLLPPHHQAFGRREAGAPPLPTAATTLCAAFVRRQARLSLDAALVPPRRTRGPSSATCMACATSSSTSARRLPDDASRAGPTSSASPCGARVTPSSWISCRGIGSGPAKPSLSMCTGRARTSRPSPKRQRDFNWDGLSTLPLIMQTYRTTRSW
mmetsp:Transcript_56903/g.149898  ORF Transcript_56903/g.149898 Transcript_56903/m.149898 type:complete len:274 (+) Transcript_56903:306-1127(+)